MTDLVILLVGFLFIAATLFIVFKLLSFVIKNAGKTQSGGYDGSGGDDGGDGDG